MGMETVEKKGLKKLFIALICVICAVAVIAGGVCAWLFIPRKGEASHEIWLSSDKFDVSRYKTVEKAPGKAFKILQLTDIQIGSLTELSETKERIQEAIDNTKPDLLLLTGDNVEGPIGGSLLKSLGSFVDSFGIPWAPIYGNHDGEGCYDLNWQGEVYESFEYCLFDKGPVTLYGVKTWKMSAAPRSTAACLIVQKSLAARVLLLPATTI